MLTEAPRANDSGESTGIPPIGRSKDPAAIRQMFSSISGTYDLLNRSLSAGLDATWRRRAVVNSGLDPAARVLDVGTGTGDLALAFAARRGFRGRIVGLDFAGPMLELARRKSDGIGGLSFLQGDALSIPCRSGAFDAVSAAFSFRNVSEPSRALAEFRRILRPGGRLILLEFLKPVRLAWPLRVYLRAVLPVIGARISGHPSAYAYLRDSQAGFLTLDEAIRLLRANGFDLDRSERLFPGFAHLVISHSRADSGEETRVSR